MCKRKNSDFDQNSKTKKKSFLDSWCTSMSWWMLEFSLCLTCCIQIQNALIMRCIHFLFLFFLFFLNIYASEYPKYQNHAQLCFRRVCVVYTSDCNCVGVCVCVKIVIAFIFSFSKKIGMRFYCQTEKTKKKRDRERVRDGERGGGDIKRQHIILNQMSSNKASRRQNDNDDTNEKNFRTIFHSWTWTLIFCGWFEAISCLLTSKSFICFYFLFYSSISTRSRNCYVNQSKIKGNDKFSTNFTGYICLMKVSRATIVHISLL